MVMNLITARITVAELTSPLAQRLLELHTRLLESDSQRMFLKALGEVVAEYIPFKFIGAYELISRADREGKATTDVAIEVNQRVLGALVESGHSQFSLVDRKILLAAFRWQANLSKFIGEVAKSENSEWLAAAFVDGFWAIQRVDVCLSVAALIAQGVLPVRHKETLHWLSLAIRQSQREFDDSLFANNPELMRRLATEGKVVSTEELERRLGL